MPDVERAKEISSGEQHLETDSVLRTPSINAKLAEFICLSLG